MEKNLSYYLHCFTHLNRSGVNGGAPHKPILLLSIINLFNKRLLINEQIAILPELVASFKSHWNQLVTSNHHPIFALPFFYMKSEPFWFLMPNLGFEKWISLSSSTKSLSSLTTAIDHALIDIELAALLLQAENRDILKIAILNKYFPKVELNYLYEAELTADVLEESSESYRKKIIDLKNKLDENAFQEEVFIRGGIFKREIPKIYNNSCAISGSRIDATANISMLDACHIVPFSEAYDDTISNGIALNPSLHRAFDRGLISISDNYKVLVKNNFVENRNSAFNISQFNGLDIKLPEKAEQYPSLENLAKHREIFGF